MIEIEEEEEEEEKLLIDNLMSSKHLNESYFLFLSK